MLHATTNAHVHFCLFLTFSAALGEGVWLYRARAVDVWRLNPWDSIMRGGRTQLVCEWCYANKLKSIVRLLDHSSNQVPISTFNNPTLLV